MNLESRETTYDQAANTNNSSFQGFLTMVISVADVCGEKIKTSFTTLSSNITAYLARGARKPRVLPTYKTVFSKLRIHRSGGITMLNIFFHSKKITLKNLLDAICIHYRCKKDLFCFDFGVQGGRLSFATFHHFHAITLG